jgi:hypothetical protein
MAVHLLRTPTDLEPARWLSTVASGKPHIAPEWPESTRFTLIGVIRGAGPRGEAHTRAVWVTTKEEMDRLLTRHPCHILWFTVPRRDINDTMIERTLGEKEPLHE